MIGNISLLLIVMPPVTSCIVCIHRYVSLSSVFGAYLVQVLACGIGITSIAAAITTLQQGMIQPLWTNAYVQLIFSCCVMSDANSCRTRI
jgi:hypothetical protein